MVPHLRFSFGKHHWKHLDSLHTTEQAQWKQKGNGKWQVPIQELYSNPDHMSECLRQQECRNSKNRGYRSL